MRTSLRIGMKLHDRSIMPSTITRTMALERSPRCLLVPIAEYPDEQDIIGSFTSYEEAEIWSQYYPGAEVQKMAAPKVLAPLFYNAYTFGPW